MDNQTSSYDVLNETSNLDSLSDVFHTLLPFTILLAIFGLFVYVRTGIIKSMHRQRVQINTSSTVTGTTEQAASSEQDTLSSTPLVYNTSMLRPTRIDSDLLSIYGSPPPGYRETQETDV